MTAEIALICDRCERRWAHFPAKTPSGARAIAADKGWMRKRVGNDPVQDICPECVKEKGTDI